MSSRIDPRVIADVELLLESGYKAADIREQLFNVGTRVSITTCYRWQAQWKKTGSCLRLKEQYKPLGRPRKIHWVQSKVGSALIVNPLLTIISI